MPTVSACCCTFFASAAVPNCFPSCQLTLRTPSCRRSSSRAPSRARIARELPAEEGVLYRRAMLEPVGVAPRRLGGPTHQVEPHRQDIGRNADRLEAVAQRSKLDYVCMDCAETRDGELLIFEIDHAMVVHAMDSEALFPYKQGHMLKVRRAFESFLFGLGATRPASLDCAA